MENSPINIGNETVLPLADSDNVSENHSNWRIFGTKLPKNEIVYGCQVVMLYIVIIVCLVNLSIGNGDSNLWTALLSSSLGYMLPAPTLKAIKRV